MWTNDSDQTPMTPMLHDQMTVLTKHTKQAAARNNFGCNKGTYRVARSIRCYANAKGHSRWKCLQAGHTASSYEWHSATTNSRSPVKAQGHT